MLYCLIYFQIPIKTKLDNELIGTITSIKEFEDYTQLVIKGKEKINCNYNGDYKFELGDEVRVKGELKEYQDNTNIGLFNMKKFYYSKRIYHYMNTDSIEVVGKANFIYRIKNKIIKRVDRIDNTGYLNVFILGSKPEGEVKESFKRNGISHLFSISGMHVGLFVLMLSFILKKCKHKSLIIILFLLFYLFLSGFSISIKRAVLLYILLTINKKYKLNFKSIDILIFIFFIFLLFNPYNIYNVGFIFTFAITFSLMFFSSCIKGNYIRKIFKTSTIAFLVSIPILINNFYEINLLSPIYNIIFVPLVSIIIFPLSIITFIFPILSDIFSFFIQILENISLLLTKIDSTIVLKRINLVFVIIYYIVIYFTIKKDNYILIILVLFIHYNISYINKYTTISFIDVGQGDSILIELDHNKGNILIDTGGAYKKEIAKFQTIPYLKSRGIRKLNYIIITHGDNDHIGELDYILDNIEAENIYFNSAEDNKKEVFIKNKYKNINVFNINKYNIKIEDYSFEFINKKNSKSENEDSLVLYTKINNYNMLFTGDCGTETENYLLSEYNLPKMDILKVGHHGSKTSSSREFINKLSPDVSVISVGSNNKFNHPSDKVLDILKNSQTDIYQTKDDGMIRITLGEYLKIETAR